MREREEEKTPNRRRKRKRVSKFRFYFINILLGVIIFAILLVMLIYFLCHLSKVTVSGSTLYTENEIEAYVLDDAYSNNTIYVYLKNLIKPKEDIPFVESVKVSIKGRNSVAITVTEKGLLGYIPLADGTYAYFDEKGTVAEVSDQLVADVMLVNGIACEKAVNGKQLDVDAKTLKTLLTLTQALRKNEIVVSSITFEDDGTMNLQYGDIVIDMGNKNYLTEKVMRLPYVLPKLEGLAGTLHLENWTEDQTDIVFKKVIQ